MCPKSIVQMQPGSIQALTVRRLPLPCGHEEPESDPQKLNVARMCP